MMQLQPVSFEEETNIRYKLYLETTGENPFHYTLIAKFSGTYRLGSAGKPDAHFIYGVAQTAIAVWHPAALILDLRELTYTWGDDMDLVLDAGADQGILTAVVGGERCLPAIGTLIHGEESKRSATEAAGIFDNLEDAWNYVRKKA